MSDSELEAVEVGRTWDVLASQEEYREAGDWVSGFVNQLDQTRPFSTREFLHQMGRELSEISPEDGLLTAAYKTRVPIFCPDISDSLINVGIAASRFEKRNSFAFDLPQDIIDLTQTLARARVSALMNIGGGAPRSFVHLAASVTDIMKVEPRGHKYAIQIGSEGPHAGGFEISTTNDDALLYGKLARGAQTAFVDCDATIALPFLITALSQTAIKYMKNRKRPTFTFAARELTVEVP